MLIFQSQHLRVAEIQQLQHLNEGEFDEKTLQKLVTKLGSTFEQYKPDKAIMQYLNQHTRQLGLEAPTFASPKEKQHNLNKVERQKSSPSEQKKNRTDRSDKNKSEQTLPISKPNLAKNPAIKKIKEKFLLTNIAEEPRASNEKRAKLIHTTNVVSRIANRLRRITSILTWAKLQARTRIPNPRVT